MAPQKGVAATAITARTMTQQTMILTVRVSLLLAGYSTGNNQNI
jgi:hypothetical protein